MAIRFYDKAVEDKIKRWVKDPNVQIMGPSETASLFQIRADIQNDKQLSLPLIAISRNDDIEILNTNKKALSYDGAHIAATEETSEVLNGIPIKLGYQLDIYTRKFAEADEYMRNFVFNIINYPKISIEIPYHNAKVVHDSTILLESTISDNSSMPEKLIHDQFTRLSLKLSIDDAYLFSVPFMKNWFIDDTGDIKVEGEK